MIMKRMKLRKEASGFGCGMHPVIISDSFPARIAGDIYKKIIIDRALFIKQNFTND